MRRCKGLFSGFREVIEQLPRSQYPPVMQPQDSLHRFNAGKYSNGARPVRWVAHTGLDHRHPLLPPQPGMKIRGGGEPPDFYGGSVGQGIDAYPGISQFHQDEAMPEPRPQQPQPPQIGPPREHHQGAPALSRRAHATIPLARSGEARRSSASRHKRSASGPAPCVTPHSRPNRAKIRKWLPRKTRWR